MYECMYTRICLFQRNFAFVACTREASGRRLIKIREAGGVADGHPSSAWPATQTLQKVAEPWKVVGLDVLVMEKGWLEGR